MSTRAWWCYYTQQRIDEVYMGTKIVFYREAKPMTTNVYEFYLVALCPHCKRVVNYLADDPTNPREVNEAKAEWEARGYATDRVAKALLWNSPRGCVCLSEDSAK